VTSSRRLTRATAAYIGSNARPPKSGAPGTIAPSVAVAMTGITPASRYPTGRLTQVHSAATTSIGTMIARSFTSTGLLVAFNLARAAGVPPLKVFADAPEVYD
jgi:hypothetical protein